MSCNLTIVCAKNVRSNNINTRLDPYIVIHSKAACGYFIGQTEFIKSSTDPIFDYTTRFPFFQARYPIFFLYSHNFVNSDQFLSYTSTDISNVFTSGCEKELTFQPSQHLAGVAKLSVRISMNYSPFLRSLFKNSMNYIYIHCSYNPPLENMSMIKAPVEVKCVTVSNERHYYSVLDSNSWWTTLGRSSQSNTVVHSSGPTQVHRIEQSKINKSLIHFIVETKDYEGTVTLNFLGVQNEKMKQIDRTVIYIPKSEPVIFDQMSIKVKPNTVTTTPYHVSVEKKGTFLLELNDTLLKDSDELMHDFEDRIVSSIINNQIYMRRNIFPQHNPVSINTCSEQLRIVGEVRCVELTMGGFTTAHSKNCPDFLIPKVFMFNKKTREMIEKPEFYCGRFVNPSCGGCVEDLGFDCRLIASNFYNRTEFRDHRRLTINFGQIDPDNALIIGVEHVQGKLCDLVSPHLRVIDSRSLVELLFCPFVFQAKNDHSALLCTLQCINGQWSFVPIFSSGFIGLDKLAANYVASTNHK